MPITTKVASTKCRSWRSVLDTPQHYVIKFVGSFSPGTLVFHTNKTDCHDITEILLKVALNIITLTLKALNSLIFYVRTIFTYIFHWLILVCKNIGLDYLIPLHLSDQDIFSHSHCVT